MKPLFSLFLLALEGSEVTSEPPSGSTEKITEALKGMVKSPVFYIVIGALVFLISAVYLVRRIVSARPNTKTIVVRGNKILKVVDENNPKYFLTPFVDRVGAVISLDDRELTSDRLFINNGPDALYQVNFTLKYHVIDAVEHYKFVDRVQDLMLNNLNEHLREFADKGNALVLVKDYREHSKEILDLINEAIREYSVEATSFKINLIQPLGRR